MKKLLSLVLSALLLLCTAISLIGCGGGDDSTISEIYVAISDGGFGRIWIDDCADRFEAAVADKSYADGKTGAIVTVNQERNALNTIETGGYAIIETGAHRKHISDPVGSGVFLNIDEWMTEENPWNEDRAPIDSYIQDATKNMVKVEGEYWGAPAWEWFGGLCYDVQLFNENGWYIADPYAAQGHNVTPEYNGTPMGSIYLINDEDSKKSCGRDGVYGTTDDGLPTTLKEFATLCFLILQEGVDVFTLPGKWLYHDQYFVSGLWAALSNFEELNASNDFQGKINAIKLDDNGEPIPTGNSLFEGVPAELTPELETEVVKIARTEDSPYYAEVGKNYLEKGNAIYGSAARYYTAAFFYIMEEYNMYVDADAGSITHTDSQLNFVFSKTQPNGTKRRAFLIDGTYWYCEALEIETFSSYEAQNDDTARALEEIQWFSLPASLDTPVEPNEDQTQYNEQALINGGETYWAVSALFEDDAETLAVAKDFLQFMVSKKELANHTAYSSNCMMYEYDLTEEQYNSLTAFGKSNFDMHKTAKVVSVAPSADNSAYLQHTSEFSLNCHGNNNLYFYNMSGLNNYYSAVKVLADPVELFMRGYFDASTWRGLATFDPTQG